MEPVTAVLPTWAVAVTTAAPAAVMLAGVRVTVAIPLLSVRAVPPAGVSVPSVESVENVAIEPEAGTPEAFSKVAVTVVGDPLVMEVTSVPAVLVSARDKLGLLPVEPALFPVASPAPQPLRIVRDEANRRDNESFENF